MKLRWREQVITRVVNGNNMRIAQMRLLQRNYSYFSQKLHAKACLIIVRVHCQLRAGPVIHSVRQSNSSWGPSEKLLAHMAALQMCLIVALHNRGCGTVDRGHQRIIMNAVSLLIRSSTLRFNKYWSEYATWSQGGPDKGQPKGSEHR